MTTPPPVPAQARAAAAAADSAASAAGSDTRAGTKAGEVLFCESCGSMPAARATFRRVQGIVIVVRWGTYHGPFCRTCGTAIYRQVTTDSLWQGWWSFWSLIANPVVMLVNLFHRHRISRLAPPVPGAPRLPLDAGKPMYRRPAILGLLVPLVIVPLLVSGLDSEPASADVGDCLHNSGTTLRPDLTPVDCGSPRADFIVLARFHDTRDTSSCARYAAGSMGYVDESGGTHSVLCLTEVELNLGTLDH